MTPLSYRFASSVLAVVFMWCSSLAIAQSIEIERSDRRFQPVDSRDLIARYPKGKRWRTMSQYRGTGTGTSRDWGLTGTVHLVLDNRYITEIEVLEQYNFDQLSRIKLRCHILQASGSKVFSKQRLRLDDFDSMDPMTRILIEQGVELSRDALPPLAILIRLGKIVGKVDPGYERLLSGMSRRLGMSPETLGSVADLKIIENPDLFEGRQFDVEWENGFGIVRVTELPTARHAEQPLELDTVRQWARGADPLADLCFFPTLSKNPGDDWSIDMDRAAPIFIGRGDAKTSGSVDVLYENDRTAGDQRFRHLRILGGSMDAAFNDDNSKVSIDVNGMRGELFVRDSDGMLSVGTGTAKTLYDKISRNHIFFEARINKDFASEFRYESELLDAGRR